MKPYFMPCAYCGHDRPLNELEHDGRGFVTCRDVLACNRNVEQAEQTYLTALELERDCFTKKLAEVNDKIAAEKKRRNLDDTTAKMHFALVKRIEEDDAFCTLYASDPAAAEEQFKLEG